MLLKEDRAIESSRVEVLELVGDDPQFPHKYRSVPFVILDKTVR
jgi:hypothetical protein